jgi:hypothetical protein
LSPPLPLPLPLPLQSTCASSNEARLETLRELGVAFLCSFLLWPEECPLDATDGDGDAGVVLLLVGVVEPSPERDSPLVDSTSSTQAVWADGSELLLTLTTTVASVVSVVVVVLSEFSSGSSAFGAFTTHSFQFRKFPAFSNFTHNTQTNSDLKVNDDCLNPPSTAFQALKLFISSIFRIMFPKEK